MQKFLILSLLIITSCASGKYPHSFFADCEKKFSEFEDMSKSLKEDDMMAFWNKQKDENYLDS